MDPLGFFFARPFLPIPSGALAVGFTLCFCSLPKLFFTTRRCRGLYRLWLKENGPQEVERDDRLLLQDPFTWQSNTGYAVFRGIYKDAACATRKAFVR